MAEPGISRAPFSLVRAVPAFLNRAVGAQELCTLTHTRLQQTQSCIFQTPQASPLSQEEIFVSFHLKKELYPALEPTEGNRLKIQHWKETLLKDGSEQPSPHCIWSHISQWKAAFHAGPKTFSGSIN